MNVIMGQFKKTVLIIIGLCVLCFITLYYLKPENDRLYVEAYNCVDYEINQTANENGDIAIAFEKCSDQIHRVTKSIYHEIIAEGKSNYITTNIDYYYYNITGHFIFGMDDIVQETMQNTIQQDLKKKFRR